MGEHTQVCGEKVSFMAKGYLNGQAGKNMLGSIKIISKTATVPMNGQTVLNTKATGKKTNNTEKEHIPIRIQRNSKGFGMKVK